VCGVTCPCRRFPVFDTIFHAAIFVLKYCGEFTSLVVAGDRPAIEEQGDTEASIGVASDF
jgi:hypothetical protein